MMWSSQWCNVGYTTDVEEHLLSSFKMSTVPLIISFLIPSRPLSFDEHPVENDRYFGEYPARPTENPKCKSVWGLSNEQKSLFFPGRPAKHMSKMWTEWIFVCCEDKSSSDESSCHVYKSEFVLRHISNTLLDDLQVLSPRQYPPSLITRSSLWIYPLLLHQMVLKMSEICMSIINIFLMTMNQS